MIRFDDVFKQYPNSNDNALNGVSLEVMRGEFVYLVGASGSGKSTFLRLVLREERPSSGKVWVAGTDVGRIRSWKVPALRRKIGVVFQDFRLLPNKTVYQNVAFALQVLGKSGHVIQQTVPATLELVGLQGKGKRMPHELSGGEQQRVAIARACVNRPSILLADEPTGNLDPDTSEGIMALLDRINRTQQTTVVMATHDANIVNSLRRRVLELSKGELVRDEADGTYLDTVRKLNDGVAGRSPIARIVESGAEPASLTTAGETPATPDEATSVEAAPVLHGAPTPEDLLAPEVVAVSATRPQTAEPDQGLLPQDQTRPQEHVLPQQRVPHQGHEEPSPQDSTPSEQLTAQPSTSVTSKRVRLDDQAGAPSGTGSPRRSRAREARGSVSSAESRDSVTLPVSPDTVGFDGEDYTTTEVVADNKPAGDLRPPASAQWSMARPTLSSETADEDAELPNVPETPQPNSARSESSKTAVGAAFAAAAPGSQRVHDQEDTSGKTSADAVNLADQALPRPRGTNRSLGELDTSSLDRASQHLPRPRRAQDQSSVGQDSADYDSADHGGDEQITLNHQSDDQTPAGKD